MPRARRPQEDIGLANTGRVEAFSDAVFAIVITLLVIDLRVPEHEPGKLLHALLEEWPSYVAFGVSFLYVGVLWVNHHGLFRRLGRVDHGLNWINLGLLCSTVVIPFPTAVVSAAFGEDGVGDDRQVALVFYTLVAAVMSLTWGAMFSYLSRHTYLLKDGVSTTWPSSQLSRPVTGVVLYAIGGLAAWFISPVVGLVTVAAMIIYHAITADGVSSGPRRRHARSRKA
jgi:uncharacterized membrane protein